MDSMGVFGVGNQALARLEKQIKANSANIANLSQSGTSGGGVSVDEFNAFKSVVAELKDKAENGVSTGGGSVDYALSADIRIALA